jgi:7-cyano-7-deazaguanine synthase
MNHAIVLLSGGIDSATCMAIACDDYDVVTPVHYQYGQLTDDLEQEQAESLAHHFAMTSDAEVRDLQVIDYESVFSHFAGGVASDRDSFTTEDGSLEEDDGRSTGYVPMRNLHLIATGAAVADVEDADAVYHGAQSGDEASYPDCRPEFMAAAESSINRSLADDEHVTLETPLVGTPKTEVLRLGEALDVPWELTYSCYEATDVDNPQPCGSCPACIERAEAFEEAGVADPFGTPEAVEEAGQAAHGD